MSSLRIAVALLVCLAVSAGCSQGAKLAQNAFDKAETSQEQISAAMFTKAWGMTRIAGSEANGKAVAEAKVALLRAQLDGTFTPAKAEEIIDKLNTQVANNEPYVSKSFAWLAFLLTQSERASAMRGNVDFYLQSQHPIAEQLSSQVPGSVDDIKASYANWEPVLGPMRSEWQKIVAAMKGPSSATTSTTTNTEATGTAETPAKVESTTTQTSK